MNLLGSYTNGNYEVKIFDDGTKIRENDLDFFQPITCESMDIKITNKCEMNCPYCHENSTMDGLHGDILNTPFIDTLLPYTELAIGGGNPLAHPDLEEFLIMLKNRNLIASMTLNQKHFIDNQDLIRRLVDEKLLYGIGISLTSATDELIDLLKDYPNAVLHVINGIVSTDNILKLFNNDFKVLILGYKQFRRGEDYYSAVVDRKMQELYDLLPKMLNCFKVVSFDNLAVKQLSVQRLLSVDEWSEFYMGDDGKFTMYVDMVKREFARSSIATSRYSLTEDIKDMFSIIRSE